MPRFPEKYRKKDITAFNMVGIIVISGQQQPTFNFPVHPCLFPISENYSLIDNAIIECAAFGCDSIWIVADRSVTPLFKKRLKNFAIDPMRVITSHKEMSYMDAKGNRPNEYYLPIYYVPVKEEDTDKRDSLSFNALTAAEYSIQLAKSLSDYATPDSFYVCSPYKVFNFWGLGSFKLKLRSPNVNFEMRYQGKTYRDGLYASFTFQPRDIGKIRSHVFKTSTGVYDNSKPFVEAIEGVEPFRSDVKLPPDQRYSARFFGPDEVFKLVDDSRHTIYYDVEEYYEIFSFRDYQDYCKSGFSLHRPKSFRTVK